jgi:hypothetical protein
MDPTEPVVDYNVLPPQSLQPQGWSDNSLASFKIDLAGRNLVMNSIFLEGTLSVTQNNQIITNQDVRIDPLVGAHALLRSVVVETQQQAQIQNTGNYYARYVRCFNETNYHPDDMYKLSKQAALQSSSEMYTSAMLRGLPLNIPGNTYTIDPVSFSIQPMCCLNQCVAGAFLDGSKTGYITLTFNFASFTDIFYGMDVSAAGMAYTITDLRLTYQSVPTSLKSASVTMKTYQVKDFSLQGGTTTFETNYDMQMTSCTAVFMPMAVRGQPFYCQTDNYRIDGVQSVSLYLKNFLTSQINFPVTNEMLLLQEYIASLHPDMVPNALSQQFLKSEKRYGLGITFGSLVNGSQVPITLEITASGVSSLAPYVCYFIASGLMSL